MTSRYFACLPAFAILAALPAAAQTPADTGQPTTELDAVVTTATRTPTVAKDVPGTVTVIDETQIDRQNDQDIRDLTRYEPGISVGNNPTRTGTTSFVIRGIGENRVLVQTDGVRVPDAPQNSQPGTYFRDYIDLENVKRIEIVRGAASSLYGSNAIGGVVSYITKDPADYLKLFDKDWYVSGRLAGDTANDALAETGTLALRTGDLESLLVATRRDGHAYDVAGKPSPNPQDFEADSFLGKLVWHATATDQLKLTAEYADRSVDTDVFTDLTPTIFSELAHDTLERGRVSLDYDRTAPLGLADTMSIQLAYQVVDRKQRLNTDRISLGFPATRVSAQDFEQDIYGLRAKFDTIRDLWGMNNHFTYGADFDFSQTTRPSDQTQHNLVTGEILKDIPGIGVFPNKPFPDSDTLLLGFYVQDEITFADSRFSLLPGLRVDYYSLDPHADALSNNSNLSHIPVESFDDAAVSPKLAANFKLTPEHTLYAQYARGFRSPPYDDANIAFSNPANGYFILPNANLKSETSDGFEIGIKSSLKDGSSFSVAGFYNLYHDFIQSTQIGIRNGLLVFQSRNLTEVEIYGVEAKGQWRITPTISLVGSMAYADSEDTDTHLPIDSVDPLKGVVGARYDAVAGDWGAAAMLTAVDAHDRVSDPAYFKAPGYATLDLSAYWEPTPHLTVNAGIYNVTDTRSFNSQDVNQLPAATPDLYRYAQPGRSFAGNITVRW
jgi:hemoglobin/transferrin/lactoferrin receptor protein